MSDEATRPGWRKVEIGKIFKVNKRDSLVSEREYERYQQEYPEPPEVHATEEDFQRFLKYNPNRVRCTSVQPADLSTRDDKKWFHMDAKEIYDDGEHYLQYECLNCGAHYDVWIPDC